MINAGLLGLGWWGKLIIDTLKDNNEVKADLLYRRGGSYERLKEYSKADRDLQQSLIINPNELEKINISGVTR